MRARRGSRTRAWLVAAALFACTDARAQMPAVPLTTQAALLSKIVAYDRNFPARNGPSAHAVVVVLVRPDDPDSMWVASHLGAALADGKTLGGLAEEHVVVPFTSGADLLAIVRQKRAAVVYVAPGFGHDVETIRAALEGASVLTVASDPRDVRAGLVLGFDLTASKPRMLLNLTSARRQQVAFKPELVRLMQVFE